MNRNKNLIFYFGLTSLICSVIAGALFVIVAIKLLNDLDTVLFFSLVAFAVVSIVFGFLSLRLPYGMIDTGIKAGKTMSIIGLMLTCFLTFCIISYVVAFISCMTANMMFFRCTGLDRCH